MPGVVVTTQTQIGPQSALRAQSGQFFVVGLTERGSVADPILVRGMADVEALSGARVSYGSVWDQLNMFFDEGGEQAYISRVVGPAATVGTLTLVDRAGSPQNTLRVDAADPGAWSANLQVRVLDGSLANTFRITVTLDGTVVEDKTNLASPADAVQAFSESTYIRCTDLGSPTSGPNNNPLGIAYTSLSAGSDDRGSVAADTYVTALDRFAKDLGSGAVAIPGQTTSTIYTGINTHCIANNRIGLLSAAVSTTKANLLTAAALLDSEYVGLFAPWVKVPDGSGGSRTVSPEGYVAACRARAHAQVGPWRLPAGLIAQANTVSDVDIKFSETDANDLDNGRVSVIRVIANTVRLYGWRSLSSDPEYVYLKDRDFLNKLVVDSERLLEQFVFSPIDSKGHLQSSIAGALTGMVDPLVQQGGLFPRVDTSTGQQIDPGYKVETGSTVNTLTTMAANEIRARLKVRISPTSGLVALEIVKVGVLSGM